MLTGQAVKLQLLLQSMTLVKSQIEIGDDSVGDNRSGSGQVSRRRKEIQRDQSSILKYDRTATTSTTNVSFSANRDQPAVFNCDYCLPIITHEQIARINPDRTRTIDG